jgi:hypothetical protein
MSHAECGNAGPSARRETLAISWPAEGECNRKTFSIAALTTRLPSIAAHAKIDRELAGRYWRVRLKPHQPNACPVELLLSRDQVFDCDIGPESAENQPITDLGLFLPMLWAITDGRVLLRSWRAHATGSELVRELVVDLAPDQTWSMQRRVRAGTATTEASAVASDQVYVAYRREVNAPGLDAG